jgi:hypothetical protein
MIGDFILEKIFDNTLIMMYYIYSKAIPIKERKKAKMRIYLTDTDEYDEISIFSRNGIEGNAEKLGISYSYLKGAYTMNKDQLEWLMKFSKQIQHCDDMMDKLDAETANEIFDDCAFECAYYYLFIDRLEKALKKECAKRKYMRRVSYAA